jgi:DNA-directed RNA polymerase specialized sigma24 family protein
MKEPLRNDKFTAAYVKELYEKHGDALVAYACCCGVDFAAAEDAVQQVSLKLLRGGSSAPGDLRGDTGGHPVSRTRK